MSAVIETTTPFIDKECLLKALDKLEVKYTIKQDEIITDRVDFYYGNQKFKLQNNHYKFLFYNHSKHDVHDFLKKTEKEYSIFYEEKLAEIERKRQQALAEAERKRLEEEAKRLEEERKAFIEKQKKAIIEKAKAKGYSVKEKKVGNKIKLVLVRHTY